MDRKTLGFLCCFFQSGTLFWLMRAEQLWMFYVFAVTFGFLWGGSSTVVTALTADIFGTRNLGSIMGIMSGAFAIGAAVGPAIGGYIYETSGHYLTAYGAGAGSLFATAGFMALLKKASNINDL
jgi:MFS family permease